METTEQDVSGFSPLSKANSLVQPGRRVLCSQDVGWKSLLLQVWETSGSVREFETVATPDQVIVLMLKGGYEVECFSAMRWKKAVYRPGEGGLTAAWNTSRLRWRSPPSQISQTLHLTIPQTYFLEAAEEYRRAGESPVRIRPDALIFSDPVVFSVAKSLGEGVRTGMPDLHAEIASRFLAVHLLSKYGGGAEGKLYRRGDVKLSDRRLSRAIDFFKHHLSEPITLDRIAREAGISPFHFAHLFRKKVGVTPHRYLVQLRMEHARSVLEQTDLPIADVAAACGYMHAGHFASAFQKQFSMSPAAYRRLHS